MVSRLLLAFRALTGVAKFRASVAVENTFLRRPLSVPSARGAEAVDPTSRPTQAAGHSEGAVVVSMAAEQGVPMDGVVILSGPSVGIFGIMREQLPLPPGSPPEAYASFDRVVAALRAGDSAPPLDPADPTMGSLAFVVRHGEAGVRYMVGIDSVDPVATLARVAQPVLLVQGGGDSSVPPHHARALRSGRDAAGRSTEEVFFPELTHFYKVAPEGLDPMSAFMLETESDPGVADALAEWMARTRSDAGVSVRACRTRGIP